MSRIQTIRAFAVVAAVAGLVGFLAIVLVAMLVGQPAPARGRQPGAPPSHRPGGQEEAVSPPDRAPRLASLQPGGSIRLDRLRG